MDLIKATIKEPLGKTYVFLDKKINNKNIYPIADESLLWKEGDKIYCKKDSVKGSYIMMKKGEAIAPQNQDTLAYTPSVHSAQFYSRWKKEVEVLGYLIDGIFKIK